MDLSLVLPDLEKSGTTSARFPWTVLALDDELVVLLAPLDVGAGEALVTLLVPLDAGVEEELLPAPPKSAAREDPSPCDLPDAFDGPYCR
jgi:hypothetical protein